jgi:monoamine oxidase
MTRKEFIKICTLLGISLPFQSTLMACSNSDTELPSSTNFSGKVIIIGAGPAGMTTGYLLAQIGVDFEILEALPTYGGRIKTNTTFTDFPIPLGAEWLHVEKGVLSEIVNDSSVNIKIDTTPYDLQNDIAIDGDSGEKFNFRLSGFDIDQKFINSSWLIFFEIYILPSVQSKIKFNTPANAIDYTSDKIKITSKNQTFEADKVVFTAPLKILQSGSINFTPALPTSKINAINKTTVWSGFKAFFEFSEKFYSTLISYDIQPETNGEKLYYDAAYGQNSSKHILGVFSVGKPAENFIAMNNIDFKNHVLSELDALFDNKATASYVKTYNSKLE